MAIVYEGILCALCGREVDIHSTFFATSGVFFPPDHRLVGFCDAPIHWDCYEPWPDRGEFARAYMQMRVDAEGDSPYWGKALLTEEVFVSVNPCASVAATSLLLAETGIELRVPLASWDSWMGGQWNIVVGRHPMVDRAVREVWPLLCKTFPTAQTLIAAVDWAAKQGVLDRWKERTRQSEEERLRKPRAHNKACRFFLREGVICPHCDHGESQYVDLSPEGKSYFVCERCGEPFGPVDLTLKRLYG